MRESEAGPEGYPSPPAGLDSIGKSARRSLEGAAGLPVGVQLAAFPWEDELCLRAMRLLEERVKARDGHGWLCPIGEVGARAQL